MPPPPYEPGIPPRRSPPNHHFMGPVPADALDPRSRTAAPARARRPPWHPAHRARPALRVMVALVPVALLIAIAYLTADLWSQMPPGVAPRHRAEAVCFTLERP